MPNPAIAEKTVSPAMRDYRADRAEFYGYRREMADFAERLTTLAAAIRANPQRLVIEGIGLASSVPHAERRDLTVIDGARVPSAADVAKSLAAYHRLHARMVGSWNALEPGERAAFAQEQPPMDLPDLMPAKE